MVGMLISIAIALSSLAPRVAEPLTLASFVRQVRRADYEGQIPALQRLYTLSDVLLRDEEHATLVRYWRGFALWRKALNGMNASGAPENLVRDLQGAIDEFDQSLAKDKTMVDSMIGKAACLMNLTFLCRSDPEATSRYVTAFMPLMKESLALTPRNPRLYWVRGPMLWYLPESKGGGQAKAFEAYEVGLKLTAAPTKRDSDSVTPTWGEAELLMNRAWSRFNASPRQIAGADADARHALKLVPYWHYVKDILLPMIERAKTAGSASVASGQEN